MKAEHSCRLLATVYETRPVGVPESYLMGLIEQLSRGRSQLVWPPGPCTPWLDTSMAQRGTLRKKPHPRWECGLLRDQKIRR